MLQTSSDDSCLASLFIECLNGISYDLVQSAFRLRAATQIHLVQSHDVKTNYATILTQVARNLYFQMEL